MQNVSAKHEIYKEFLLGLGNMVVRARH